MNATTHDAAIPLTTLSLTDVTIDLQHIDSARPARLRDRTGAGVTITITITITTRT